MQINAYLIFVSIISLIWSLTSLLFYFRVLKNPQNPKLLAAFFCFVALLRLVSPSSIGATILYLVCAMLSAGYVICEQKPSAGNSPLPLATMWTNLIEKYWKYNIVFSICFAIFYYALHVLMKVNSVMAAYPAEMVANAVSGLIVGHLAGSAIEYLQAKSINSKTK